MNSAIQITFDCVPLRAVPRWDIPMDASVEYRRRCNRLKQAAVKHGFYNSYYLCNGRCEFNMTNDPDVGLLVFHFEGTILTDSDDRCVNGADLDVQLEQDLCDWITAPVVSWFEETVRRAVKVDFERFLQECDPGKAYERIQLIETEMVRCGGFVGMGL